MRKLFPRSRQRFPSRAARRGEAATGPGRTLPPGPPAPRGEQVRKASRQQRGHPARGSGARSPGRGDPRRLPRGRLGAAGPSAGSGHLGWERAGPSPYFSRGTRGLPPRLQQLPAGRARPEHFGAPVAVGQLRRGSRLPAPLRRALDPINRRPPPPSGLCPGRWGRGGGEEAAPSPIAVPLARGRLGAGSQARGAASEQRGGAGGCPLPAGGLPGRVAPRHGGRRVGEGGGPVRSCRPNPEELGCCLG